MATSDTPTAFDVPETTDTPPDDPDSTRVYAVPPSNLALYASDNHSAWISAENPVNCREVR